MSIFSINCINQYYWYIKTLKAFFCIDFFSVFRHFLSYISSLLIYFIILLTFSKIFIYQSNNFSLFITKYIHLVLSKYSLYILISGKNMHKGLICLLSL